MNSIDVLIPAIVLVITDWTPTSSSGHIAISQQYFSLNIPVLFDATLHFGTLVARAIHDGSSESELNLVVSF